MPRLHLARILACALLIASAGAPPSPAAAQGADDRELVVLVHGMGRSPLSMWPLARALEQDGYRVLNWGYSSTCCTVAELGERLRGDVAEARGDARRVHFVGHSLGNILVRWMFAHEPPPGEVGRLVMLAPPNQGSRAADRFSSWLGWLLVPISELRTDATSTVRSLPPLPDLRVGVVSGAGDAKVSITESHLEGESAHVVVAGGHSLLMLRPSVHRLVLTFLRSGRFGVEDCHARPAREQAPPLQTHLYNAC